jgi:hypothetical protein
MPREEPEVDADIWPDQAPALFHSHNGMRFRTGNQDSTPRSLIVAKPPILGARRRRSSPLHMSKVHLETEHSIPIQNAVRIVWRETASMFRKLQSPTLDPRPHRLHW